ncbi:MAG: TPM domain-containing protein [Burkholderiales bacterium]
MNLRRVIRHLVSPRWIAARAFPKATLARIEAAIRASEAVHRGELRFVVESDLALLPLLRGVTPRQRALEMFARLGVWDTEFNSGVLIYVQLVDHCIEIVADRGISAKVPPREWEAICHRMEQAFRNGKYEEGALAGIGEITDLLARHFPAQGANPNPDELPDKPVLL